MRPINVFVADPHPIFGIGLRRVLAAGANVAVIGDATDADLALWFARTRGADVVLADVTMRDRTGVLLVERLREKLPHVLTIAMTAADDDEALYQALRAGAAGLWPRAADHTTLIAMIRQVAGGEDIVAQRVMARPDIALRVLRDLRRETDGSNGGLRESPLSQREQQVLACLVSGQSNKEIARLLKISAMTVKNHMTAVLRKLEVSDRTQAVVHAVRLGLVDLRAS